MAGLLFKELGFKLLEKGTLVFTIYPWHGDLS